MNEARMKALARRIRVQEERMISDILYGSQTSTVTSEQPPISADALLDHLRKLALQMPKTETWLSTKLFPPGKQAIRVEGSGENFLVAHPSFWMELQCHVTRNQMPENPMTGRLLFSGIQITEIDLDGAEDDARRKYLRSIWGRLIDAIKVASVELPDWLRSAPKFGEHG